MVHGSREAVLRKVQPISVHGQISLDVHYVYADDDTEQVRVARIGPEAMPKGVEAGDRVVLDFVLGVVTNVKRVPPASVPRPWTRGSRRATGSSSISCWAS